MKKLSILLLFTLVLTTSMAQNTYRDLSEKAIELIENDSLPQAEVLLKEAMALEPANPYNALLFTNLGFIQKRMGKYEQAIESYTYAVNLSPSTLPILLDRAALYMDLGMNNQAYYDYIKVVEIDHKNKEA